MDRQNSDNLDTNSSRTENEDQPAGGPPQARRIALPRFALTFVIMFGVWILLSGRFDAFHLSLGLISCGIVSYLSSDLLFSAPRPRGLLSQWARFIRYIPWLMVQIIKANLHVTYLTLHPRMMELIDPRIIKFQSKLKSDLALVTFANSITLTPGTITVDIRVMKLSSIFV